MAETGGEAYPGAADDGEDLREDEVAEGELAREMVVAGGVGRRETLVGPWGEGEGIGGIVSHADESVKTGGRTETGNGMVRRSNGM